MALHLFLSPLISLVVNKAADSLIQQFCQMSGMEDNRQKLRRQLLAVQEIVADAERRGVDSAAVQEWMKELQAAAYKAVDLLDEFQYEALRREAIHQQPFSSAKVTKDFFSSKNPILFHQKMSDKLTKILGKINEIVFEMKNFDFVPRHPKSTIDRESQSIVEESEIIGREGEQEKIVKMLLDPQRERDNTSVFTICGMGGLGKTTLAQLVYNHEEVKGHFQLLLWICVSTEFDVINIVKSVIQVAQKGGDVSSSNKEVLQQQLREILYNKKYLLILDDVWNEEKRKWDELKTLLFSGAGSGSVVIVTTRSKEVASIMGTLSGHDLEFLTEENSWKLFEKKAFSIVVRKSEELITIGKTIVRKCAGLPLALKAIGGLLGTKPDVHDWRIVVENNIWESLASGDIFPLLKLSYDQLPSYMQQCFAFCAVFPQDYSIERDILIQLWMANDFIPTDGTMNLEEKGQYIFNELYWRSFFQDIRENDTKYGSIITCEMHDLMHDLATQVAGKKCSTRLELDNPRIDQKEIQHLSLRKYESLELKQFPVIRTLLVSWNLDYLKEKHYNSLKSSPLRALEFHSNFSPPKELRHMKHLRYIDLSHSYFNTLPESISKLYNLQTLKLSNCRVRELPEGMRYMINLRHLFLNGCPYLERMPIGLGQLKYLQTLTKYVVDHERGGNIGELRNLNLCGHLSLSGLEKVRDKGDAEVVRLSTKSNLCSLKLKWDSKNTTENNQAILEALRPPVGLKFLQIKSYDGSNFSKWIKEDLIIKNLKRLMLSNCKNCSELPPVWHLPSLEYLCLKKMKILISIVGGSCKNADGSESLIAFSNLKFLRLYDLPKLESWHERDSELVNFPNLNKLKIINCPRLKTIPVRAPLLAKLKVIDSSMIQLQQISNVPMLSFLEIRVEPRSFPKTDAFRPPKTLKEMTIEGFENVNAFTWDQNCQTNLLRMLTIKNSNCFSSCGETKLALRFWKHFAALEKLQIGNCNNLVYWPEEEFRSLKCLKTLEIDNCEKFTGALPVSSSPKQRGEESLPLPQLESLHISLCPELVEVSNHFMSLSELVIVGCPKLSQEWSANLTKLKILRIWSCTNWKSLPDNMVHLPSLERLWISNCPEIESFPEGLQQLLPSLQHLWIYQCPVIQRRCSRGGDYWHLVSSIPDIDLGKERVTKSESMLVRLLPVCGRS